jgi:hypothetical protein
MKIDTLTEDAINIHSTGAGTLTRNTVRERAVQPAVIYDRSARASKSDWEQPKRELTGEPDTYLNEALLESAPEPKRRDQQPGFTGHMVPVASLDEEDAEGRCYSERLFEEGFKEAAHV